MADVEGGDKLEEYLEKLAERARPVSLKVGLLEGEQATKGAMAEFGTASEPPRPFIWHTVTEHSPEWPAIVQTQLLATQYNTVEVANQLGAIIAGQIAESIIDWELPPNAPSTVKRKGFNDPLMETGAMSKSVSWEVEE